MKGVSGGKRTLSEDPQVRESSVSLGICSLWEDRQERL
jgi:hypothetical protein